MNQEEKPILIPGGLHTDQRGSVGFVNELQFSTIKRFYHVTNSLSNPIRAFQCHQKEAKYAYVVSGAAKFVAAYLDKLPAPSQSTARYSFKLEADKPQVLYIPPHFANGFKALLPDTTIIFFSTLSLEDSKNDDLRLPHDYWGAELWEDNA